jgi:hypothetical protein
VNPAELDRVTEIELRTSLSGCAWASRPVWVVVLDGNAYARSAFGIRSAWYRRVQAGCRTEIQAGGSLWAVRLERVAGDDLNRHIFWMRTKRIRRGAASSDQEPGGR